LNSLQAAQSDHRAVTHILVVVVEKVQIYFRMENATNASDLQIPGRAGGFTNSMAKVCRGRLLRRFVQARYALMVRTHLSSRHQDWIVGFGISSREHACTTSTPDIAWEEHSLLNSGAGRRKATWLVGQTLVFMVSCDAPGFWHTACTNHERPE
jgi:hypothetical protein